jgi:hypothetical protein
MLSSGELLTSDCLVLNENVMLQVSTMPAVCSAFFEHESACQAHDIVHKARLRLGVPLTIPFFGLMWYSCRWDWLEQALHGCGLLALTLPHALIVVMARGAMLGATVP